MLEYIRTGENCWILWNEFGDIKSKRKIRTKLSKISIFDRDASLETWDLRQILKDKFEVYSVI
jgi:hypothetical protein